MQGHQVEDRGFWLFTNFLLGVPVSSWRKRTNQNFFSTELKNLISPKLRK